MSQNDNAFPFQTRIIIVDDYSRMRVLLKKFLADLGYDDVTEAEDGEMALKLIRKARAADRPFGLIISDWNMPIMTGLELLKAVRGDKVGSDIPFLLVTSKKEAEDVLEAGRHQVSEYLIKPINIDSLGEKLSLVYRKTRSV